MWPFGRREANDARDSAPRAPRGTTTDLTKGASVAAQLAALKDLGLTLRRDMDAAQLQRVQDTADPQPEPFQVLLLGAGERWERPIRQLVVADPVLAEGPTASLSSGEHLTRAVRAMLDTAEDALGAPGHVTDVAAEYDDARATGTVTASIGDAPVVVPVEGHDLSPVLDAFLDRLLPPRLVAIPLIRVRSDDADSSGNAYRRLLVPTEHAQRVRTIAVALSRAPALTIPTDIETDLPSGLRDTAGDATGADRTNEKSLPASGAAADLAAADSATARGDQPAGEDVRRRISSLVEAGLRLDPRLTVDQVANAVVPVADAKDWDPYLDAVVNHPVRGEIPAWANIFRFPPEDTMADSADEWVGVVGDIARSAGTWDKLSDVEVVYETSPELPAGIELIVGGQRMRVEADVWGALLDLVAVARLCEALTPRGRTAVHLPNHTAWVQPRRAEALSALIGSY